MNTSRKFLLPLAASIATLLAPRAPAQIPWLAAPANNNWNNAANWSGGNVPDTNTELAVFDTSTFTSVNLSAAITVQKITFNATAPAYTIGGSALTIDVNTTSTTAPDAILVNAGAGAVTINNALTFNDTNNTSGNAAPTITVGTGATLTLNGAINSTGRNFPMQGNGTVNINGAITAGAGQIQQSGNTTINLFTNPATSGQIRSFSNGGGGIRIGTSLNKALGLGVTGGNTHFGRIFLVNDGVVSSGALSTGGGTGTGVNTMDVTFGTDILGTGAATQSAGFVFTALGAGFTGTTATIRLDVGADDTLNMTGVISGAAGGFTTPVFRKQGPGTAVLSAANTYTIPTEIAAGTLIVTPAQTGNSAMNVLDGAMLNVRLSTAGTTFNTSALTLGNSTGGTLRLDTGLTGNPTAPVVNATAFTTTGTNTIDLTGGGLTTATGIPLIGYTGAIGGAGFGGLTLALPFRISGTLVDNAGASRVDVNLTVENPKWNGNLPGGIWNIDDGSNTVGALNWRTSSTLATTGYIQAPAGIDAVIFDDSATGTTSVNLNTVVSPRNVTFSNDTKTYTLGGAGKISGANGVVKSGAGTVIFANPTANDYTGLTAIGGGTIQIGNGATAGVGSIGLGTVAFSGTGVLTINRPDDVTFTNATSGTGTLTKIGATNLTLTGAVSHNGVTNAASGTLTLNPVAASNFNSAITGAATLVKTGTPTASITSENAATHTGPINVTGGVLQFGGGALGTAVGGAGLTGSPGSGLITVNTGTSVRFARNDTSLVVPNVITGAGAVTVGGAFGSIVELSGVNTFTGAVTVDGGSLRIRQLANLGAGNKTITLNNGTTGQPGLRLDGSGGNITLPSGISFTTSSTNAINAALINEAGDNTIAGNFTLSAGGGSTRIRVDAGSLLMTGNFTPSTTLRFLQLDGAANGTITGNINNQNATNTLGLSKDGGGTWTLTGANNYSVSTTVNAGTLLTTTAQLGNAPVVVAAGATFGVAKITESATFPTSSLNIGNGGAATLRLDAAGLGNPTAPFVSATGFIVGGGSLIDLRGGLALTAGTFPAVAYTGAIGGAGFAGLTLTASPRIAATLVDNPGNLTVDINVTGVNFPRWNGDLGPDWDFDTGANTALQNWRELGSGNPTRYRQGAPDTDAILFNDAATGSTLVNLTTTLTPDGVKVDNSTLPYSFTGAGKISGSAALLKTGGGTLTIANTGGNDYTGLTRIDGGTVVIGNGATAGAGSLGAGGVVFNATLILDRPDNFSIAGAVSGNGTLTKSNTNTATLAGVATIGGAINLLDGTLRFTAGGNVSGIIAGDSNLTVDGGTLELSGGSANTFSGVTTVNSGTLRLNKSSVEAIGGDLIINGTSTVTMLQNFQIADTATVTHNGSVTFDPVSFSDTIANLNVNCTGAAQFIVRGLWSITGATTVNSGVLSIGSSAVANLGSVTLTGGTFRIAANNGPTTASIAADLIVTGGTIEVGQGTGAFDAELDLGGNVTATATFSITRGGFTGAQKREINLLGGTRNFDIAGGTTTTILPDIQNGSVTKTGAGTLTLNGVQGYTALTATAGVTNINANAVNAAIVANAAVNFSTSQTLASLDIGPGGVATLGTPPPAPAPFDAPLLAGESSAAVVPEPGTAALLLSGALLVLARRRAGLRPD